MTGPRLGTIDEALDELRGHRSVAIPTETVYGLGTDARSSEAIRGLRKIKEERVGKPFGALVSNLTMARALAGEWPQAATRLSEAIWPGPLTLVLPAAGGAPRELITPEGTIGLRMPDHPQALELIERFGGPLASTSANKSGAPAPTIARGVMEALPDVDLVVIDGGACGAGVASTVLSLVDPAAARVLREGGVTRATLEHLLGMSVV